MEHQVTHATYEALAISARPVDCLPVSNEPEVPSDLCKCLIQKRVTVLVVIVFNELFGDV